MSDAIQPNLSSLIRLREEAGGLRLTRGGKVPATRSGGHLSRFRGRGMEFDESRVYQVGDDPRNMDWRVTARAGTPHVKQFREERERPVWLLVDLGPRMRFGTRVAFKSVVAAHAAALLGWAAVDQGDRVGGLIFDETRHHERRPAARTRGLLPLLKYLCMSPRTGCDGGYRGIAEAVTHLERLVRPGGLVFVVSDFLAVDLDRCQWVNRLAGRGELLLVHVYDPLEAHAPPAGLYPVTDGGFRGVLDTRSGVDRERYDQRLVARVGALERIVRSYGAHLLSLSTDEAVGTALQRGLGLWGTAPGRGR